MDSPVTRTAAEADVSDIVAVHLASFTGFFLSSLGSHFLSLFYRGIIESERGILLVATAQDRVVGFVGGATEQAGFYRQLLRSKGVSFAFAGAIALLRNPKALSRLIRARSRGRDDEASPAKACLMTLGVDPTLQARGIGKTLVKEFENTLRRDGIDAYVLTTDADDNDNTNRFYASLGLTISRIITTPEGRRLNEYIGNI